MPEPRKLDYAPPDKHRSGLSLITVILGVSSGPLAVGLAALTAYLESDPTGILFGVTLPFLLVGLAGMLALTSEIGENDRRRAIRGLIAAGMWLVLLIAFIGYCAWALHNNPM